MERHWYRSSYTVLTILLLPLSLIFRGLVTLRRFLYRRNILKTYHFSVPIIVVGNITVGGTGKTPFVIWLAQLLKSQGFLPGIVTRGVGGRQQPSPRWINRESSPAEVGDEAILLAKRTQVPVVVGIDRVAAVRELLAKTNCNVVISDDGLQHYRLGRHIEIAIMDGARGLGNENFLPAGPLRESPARLAEVDFVIWQDEKKSHPFSMQLLGDKLVCVKDEANTILLESIRHKQVHACAAIGNPVRFFTHLKNKNISIREHNFPDHYLYRQEDFNFGDDKMIIMTEKDAVKCQFFATEKYWYLPVEAVVSEEFEKLFLDTLRRVGCVG